ncbi:hypothetical protein C8J56DRAFT_923898 [Mycena floridula]|nr:hypothetical protein C8J56DRAFT_923898 [Mycena floridula]
MSSADVHPTAVGSATRPDTSKTPNEPISRELSHAEVRPSKQDTPTAETHAGETVEAKDPATKHLGPTPHAHGVTIDEGKSEEGKPNGTSGEGENTGAPDGGYPEQLHAGKVGYGPNYRQGAGFLDKVGGAKEQVIGKLTRNPDKAAHGHDKMTGHLKEKELEEDMKEDPFADPEEKTKGAEGDNASKAEVTGSKSTEKVDTTQQAKTSPEA